MSRRTAMGVLAAASAAAVVGCSADGPFAGADQVGAAEARRPTTGRVVRHRLAAALSQVDLGAGTVVSTWTYGGALPGAVLRAAAGDRLRVRLDNALSEPTSVHWHGPAVRNDVDGVPGLTTAEVGTGRSATFEFVVPTPGTHWLHPHHGVQLDRGLYAPMVIDDPGEPGDYDEEVLVVLDDWTDGLGPTPADILAELRRGGGMHAGRGNGGQGGMQGMGMRGNGMGGMHAGAGTAGWVAGDWEHAAHLVNGRLGLDPVVRTVAQNARVRLRIINAAADTAYRVAVGGHRMTITHTDGFAVVPVEAGSVLVGMGERLDAVVTMRAAVAPVVAAPQGKAGLGRMVLRGSAGAPLPPVDLWPAELDGEPVLGARLQAAESARLDRERPDRVENLVLEGGMGSFTWTINGRSYEDTRPLRTRQGERVRLRVVNRSMMAHPLHLHGHTAQVVRSDGSGARKDTVLVPPMGRFDLDVDADNPGQWMVHCHNAYHAASGMMTRLEYLA